MAAPSQDPPQPPRDETIRAAQQGPSDARHRPVDLHLDRNDGLYVKWADGNESHYSLVFLRKNCPCATCRELHPAPEASHAGLSLNVLPPGIDRATVFADARLVGRYAIQITWADGHSTGIYDFRYLRALADQPPG